MKNLSKKALSVVMAVLVVLSMMSLQVFATSAVSSMASTVSLLSSDKQAEEMYLESNEADNDAVAIEGNNELIAETEVAKEKGNRAADALSLMIVFIGAPFIFVIAYICLIQPKLKNKKKGNKKVDKNPSYRA